MSEPVGVHRVEKKRLNPWWVLDRVVWGAVLSTILCGLLYVVASGVATAWAIAHGAKPDDVMLGGVVCLSLCAAGVCLAGVWAFIELQLIFNAWLDRLSDLGRNKHVDKE